MTLSKKIAGLTLLAILSTGVSVFAQTAVPTSVGTPVSSDTVKTTTTHVKMTDAEKTALAAKRAEAKKLREDAKVAATAKRAEAKKLRDDAKKLKTKATSTPAVVGSTGAGSQ